MEKRKSDKKDQKRTGTAVNRTGESAEEMPREKRGNGVGPFSSKLTESRRAEGGKTLND